MARATGSVFSREIVLAAIPSPVVNTLPTNTVNMTGFRRWCRGSSFRAESRSARTRMSRSSHARGVAVLIVPPR